MTLYLPSYWLWAHPNHVSVHTLRKIKREWHRFLSFFIKKRFFSQERHHLGGRSYHLSYFQSFLRWQVLSKCMHSFCSLKKSKPFKVISKPRYFPVLWYQLVPSINILDKFWIKMQIAERKEKHLKELAETCQKIRISNFFFCQWAPWLQFHTMLLM